MSATTVRSYDGKHNVNRRQASRWPKHTLRECASLPLPVSSHGPDKQGDQKYEATKKARCICWEWLKTWTKLDFQRQNLPFEVHGQVKFTPWWETKVEEIVQVQWPQGASQFTYCWWASKPQFNSARFNLDFIDFQARHHGISLQVGNIEPHRRTFKLPHLHN